MVSCRLQTSVLLVVKGNSPNERVYQLNYGNNRDSTRGYKVLH